MKRFSYLCALCLFLSVSLSGYQNNTPNVTIVKEKLDNYFIRVSRPESVKLSDRTIKPDIYYLIAEPDTAKLQARKKLVLMREGLDSLANSLSEKNPGYIFLVHDIRNISDKVASLIENSINASTKTASTAQRMNVSDMIKVYPNPCNPDAIIEYNAPASMHARISIVDILGRERTVFDGNVDSKTIIRGAFKDMSTGAYFVRVHGNSGDKEYIGTFSL